MIDKSSDSKSDAAIHGIRKPGTRFALLALSGAMIVMFAGSQLMGDARAVAALPEKPAMSFTPAGPPSFSELVAKVKPAVVNVAVTKDTLDGGRIPEHFAPEFHGGVPYREFFQRFFGEDGVPERAAPERRFLGQGSGFIVDPAGYVVTSDHVIANASEISVVLNDGKRYTGRVQGRDPKTDLALLKIEAGHPLPYVQFGESDSTRAGDWVVAVGNPFGFGGTVTAGIISARGRDIQSGPFDDFLQIDAPINRGNSGGPLFDSSGRVIGVNSSIYSPTGGNVGIGFAVPASLAEPIVRQLKAAGSVQRGWLGVQVQAVTEDIAEYFGLDVNKGALVANVMPDSPAARAGLRPVDIILGIDGQEVDSFKHLTKLVADARAGSDTLLDIQRRGRAQQIQVRIGRMPGHEEQVAENDSGAEPAPAPKRLGIYLAELTAESRQKHGIPEGVHGVLVAGIAQGSPAARAGIRAGNLISMVDQTPVAHPDEVVQKVQAASSSDRASVLLRVHSGDAQRFVPVRFAA